MKSDGDAQKSAEPLLVPGYIEVHPLTDQPMVLPSRVTWPNLLLEHYHLPPGECSHTLPQHLIRLALQAALPLERRYEHGRLQNISVRSGDVTFCPAYSHQWMRWLEEAEFLLLWLPPALLTRLAEEAHLPVEATELLMSDTEIKDPFIQRTALLLRAEMAAESTTLSTLYVETLTTALAAHLLKQYCSAGKTAMFPAPKRITGAPWKRVVEYIQAHLGEALTINELAAQAGLSPYHFTRSFKQTLGLSPHQYILNMRIEYAKTHLLCGEQTLAELASRLGFADQSHFTRSFKRLVGVTPQQYLRERSAKIF